MAFQNFGALEQIWFGAPLLPFPSFLGITWLIINKLLTVVQTKSDTGTLCKNYTVGNEPLNSDDFVSLKTGYCEFWHISGEIVMHLLCVRELPQFFSEKL